MIVRGIRSQSRLKADQHRHLERAIDELRAENKQLRFDVLKLEQRLLQSQQHKQKYKTKYRQAKQKVEILGLVGLYSHKLQDHYDCCPSPRIKTTRMRTASEEEFLSLKCGLAHSEFEENFSTRPYIPESDEYQIASRKNLTPTTTIREDSKEDFKIIEGLMKVHEVLEKLSAQIEKSCSNSNVLHLESELYRKLQQVVDKVNQLESRDLERERQRASRENDKSKKRYKSSMKAVEQIGKSLLEFKVDQ